MRGGSNDMLATSCTQERGKELSRSSGGLLILDEFAFSRREAPHLSSCVCPGCALLSADNVTVQVKARTFPSCKTPDRLPVDDSLLQSGVLVDARLPLVLAVLQGPQEPQVGLPQSHGSFVLAMSARAPPSLAINAPHFTVKKRVSQASYGHDDAGRSCR